MDNPDLAEVIAPCAAFLASATLRPLPSKVRLPPRTKAYEETGEPCTSRTPSAMATPTAVGVRLDARAERITLHSSVIETDAPRLSAGELPHRNTGDNVMRTWRALPDASIRGD